MSRKISSGTSITFSWWKACPYKPSSPRHSPWSAVTTTVVGRARAAKQASRSAPCSASSSRRLRAEHGRRRPGTGAPCSPPARRRPSLRACPSEKRLGPPEVLDHLEAGDHPPSAVDAPQLLAVVDGEGDPCGGESSGRLLSLPPGARRTTGQSSCRSPSETPRGRRFCNLLPLTATQDMSGVAPRVGLTHNCVFLRESGEWRRKATQNPTQLELRREPHGVAHW